MSGVGVVAGEAAAPHQGEHSLSLTLLLSLLPPARLWYSNLQYLQSLSAAFRFLQICQRKEFRLKEMTSTIV